MEPASRWQALHATLAQDLAEAIAQVQGAGPAGTALRDALESLVIAHARDQLLLHRVWFQPFGFEARPDSLPALETLLADAPDT